MSKNPYGLNANLSSVKSSEPSYILPWKNGNWGPPDWYRYKVRFGDNWWKIANKDGWNDPMDLIEYNFKTRKPKEVNWYLRNFVGCQYATPDGLNHIFSDNLKPGYIYTIHKLQPQDEVPTVPARIPWPDTPKHETNLLRPGVWVGVGGKVGAFAGLGYDRTEALMFSSDFSDVYSMSIDTMKFGGGAGLGATGVVVIATGLPTLKDLKYCVINGMDWNFAIGLRLKGLASTAAGMGGVRRLMEAAKFADPGPKALTEGATTMKALIGTSNAMDLGTKPSVTVIEIPFAGVGADISLYSGRSTFGVRTIRDSDLSLLDAISQVA